MQTERICAKLIIVLMSMDHPVVPCSDNLEIFRLPVLPVKQVEELELVVNAQVSKGHSHRPIGRGEGMSVHLELRHA